MLDNWLMNLFPFLNGLSGAAAPQIDLMADALSGIAPAPVGLTNDLTQFAAGTGFDFAGSGFGGAGTPPAGGLGVDLGALLQGQPNPLVPGATMPGAATRLPLSPEAGGIGVQLPQVQPEQIPIPQDTGAGVPALGNLLQALQGLGVPEEPPPSQTHPKPPGPTNISSASKKTESQVPGLFQAQAPTPTAAAALPQNLSLAQMLGPLLQRR